MSSIDPCKLKALRLGVVLAAAAAASPGCVTAVPQSLPRQMLPPTFEGPVGTSAEIWPQANWWQNFGDPQMTALIARAQSQNQDLAVAAARVMQAQAQTVIQRSALFPQLGAQAGHIDGGCRGESCLDFVPQKTFGLTFNASYEPDLWGLARNNLRAAKEQLKSARFAQQSISLAVTADVADQYLNVLAIRRRIAIANEYIAAINDILQVIKLHVEAGAASKLDLARERAQVEAVNAQLAGLETLEKQFLVTLAVLLGQPPEGFDVKTENMDAILVPPVGPGLPSDLLLRRPDISQAEANLAAAHANVDAARAAFLPQISLTGSGGFVGAAISALIQGGSFGYSYGANLLQTVFDGGARTGRKYLAEATQREFLADYQSAVLNAFADVEIALVQVAKAGQAQDHLRREVEAAREAFEISQLQYREGAADLLSVLQAQQTLFSAEDQLTQTALDNGQAAIHLYEALGGGWVKP